MPSVLNTALGQRPLVVSKTWGTVFSKYRLRTYFLWLEVQEENNPVFQEGLDEKEEMMETAETHQRSQAHSQKELEFQGFRNLYEQEIHPNLMKYEDVSSSAERRQMKDVGLDLDRLERSRNNLFSALEKIESSRCWTETASLLVAVKDFKAELEKTSPILEQGQQARV